jgi:parallel beta-helix repeat protein
MDRRSGSLLLVIIFVLSTFNAALITLPMNVRAATLFVGGTGPGNYTDIQSAIDAADPGDTVFVYSGSYDEMIVINKTLTLKGEDRDTTSIHAVSGGDVIHVTADYVNISGFTVTDSWSAGAAIKLFDAENCHISDNYLNDNDDGIVLDISHNNTITDNIVNNSDQMLIKLSNYNVISGNIVTNSYVGIRTTYANYNVIENNSISDNHDHGMLLYISRWNTLANNTISSSQYGYGIYLQQSMRNSLTGNKMQGDGIVIDGPNLLFWEYQSIDTSNTVNGGPVYFWKNYTGGSVPAGAGQVILYKCRDVKVENQNVSRASVGIAVTYSSRITVSGNDASMNKLSGIQLIGTFDSTVINNLASGDPNIGGGGDGISLVSSGRNTIDNNDVTYNGHGVWVESSPNNIISNNNGSHSGYSIGLRSSDGNVVVNNDAHECGWGISLGWSNHTYVANNSASLNSNDGITTGGTGHNKFINNTLSSNRRHGIDLVEVHDVTVDGNHFYSNIHGLVVWRSQNSTIINNEIADSTKEGIYLAMSNNLLLKGNSMTGTGIVIGGNHLQDWNNHDIDTSNTVSGRPVYYWKNKTGGTVPSGAGQVILANCRNVLVQNQNVSDGSRGIALAFSPSNTIDGNIASFNTMEGVFLFSSDNTTITNNEAQFGEYGIRLYDSFHNDISSNNVSFNTRAGMDLREGHWNSIEWNEVHFNERYGLLLEYSDYLTVSNNSVTGNERGIYLQYYVRDSTFMDNYVSYNVDGFGLGNSPNRNTIARNTIDWNSRHGIFITGKDLVITDNTMVGNGIYMGGHRVETWSTHTIDTSNTVNGKPVYYWKNAVGGTIPSGAGQVILVGCANVTIDNQNVSQGTAGIQIAFSSRITISNNTASDNNMDGIYIKDSSTNTLTSNVASYNRHGIYLRYSSGSTLSDNVMEQDGILLEGSNANFTTQVIDTSNTVNGKPVYYWQNVIGGTIPSGAGQVILAECENITVENQNLSDGSVGILAAYSSGLTIQSNEISHNSWAGIHLYGYTDSLIANNTVSDSEVGISADGYSGLVIINNTISHSEIGLQLFVYIEGAIVYHNNFINNTLQAYDDGSIFGPPYSSIWDNGYPSGGNYWSDYSGVDNCSGPNQDICPDSDGIGDTPQLGYMWFTDHYPLMAPFSTSPSAPSAPQNLQATPGNQQVHLKWIAPYDGGSPITNYRIYRGTTPGGELFLIELGNVLEYTDTGLVNGQTYYYRVSAVNAVDEGPLSNEASATPADVPGPPLSLSAAPGDGEVSLTWNAPVDDGGSPVTNYRVYRGTSSGGEVFLIELGNVLQFTDTGLSNGQRYFYEVSAVNLVGEGLRSNEADAVPTATPGPPAHFAATLSGSGVENVSLRWNLSSDDGAGQNSVIGYNLYRGTTYDHNGTGYQLIAFLPSGTSNFNDESVGEGDTNNYFYRICAVDLNNKSRCSGEQAAKFIKHLPKGMVLLSMPLIVQDNSTSTVFQTVSFVRILIYEEKAGKKHNWKVFDKRKPYSKLPYVNYTMAFWVEVTADSYFTVAGTVPQLTTISLHEGWNFVSYPSFVDRSVSDTLSTHYQTIETFDPTDPPWLLKRLGDGDLMMAGEGYWIHVSQDYDWVLPN